MRELYDSVAATSYRRFVSRVSGSRPSRPARSMCSQMLVSGERLAGPLRPVAGGGGRCGGTGIDFGAGGEGS